MSLDSQKKVALVTGVSRLKGIGFAICKALARQGHGICFTYWTAYDQAMPWGVGSEEPDQILQELLKFDVPCQKIELDLTQDQAGDTLLAFCQKELAFPHILVNNATHSVNSHWESLSPEFLDAHYHLNVRATTLLSLTFAKGFPYSEGGRIISLSSGQSLGPMPDELPYAMTKGAMDIFTRHFAAEVGVKGITVNAVNPGPTDTGWMNAEIEAELLPRFPSRRMGLPQDAAKLIAWLSFRRG